MQGGSGHDFRGLSPRPPSTSMSWDVPNPGNTGSVRSNVVGAGILTKSASSSTGILQTTTSGSISNENSGVVVSQPGDHSPPLFARR